MSQAAIAQLLGVSQSTASVWLRGTGRVRPRKYRRREPTLTPSLSEARRRAQAASVEANRRRVVTCVCVVCSTPFETTGDRAKMSVCSADACIKARQAAYERRSKTTALGRERVLRGRVNAALSRWRKRFGHISPVLELLITERVTLARDLRGRV